MYLPVPPRPDPVPKLPPKPNDPLHASGDPSQPPAFRGSFRLSRLAGTDVFVHWSWFLAAYFLIKDRPVPYSSPVWHVVEYVAGFGLVLLHEFGHVLACRQVGGTADRVVLWPLGGLALVAPPPRPGASLWTTAAGPLVNAALAPLLIGLAFLTAPGAEADVPSDLSQLIFSLAWFNAVMLVFNLLPVFPLDGGRILQAVLWWGLGRPMSLAIAAGVGVIAAAGLGALAIALGEWWLALLAGFMALGALGGVARARTLAQLRQAERRPGLACPTCAAAPPIGDFWRCNRCLAPFDLFNSTATCPKGGSHATEVQCPECERPSGSGDWSPTSPVEPNPAAAP